jgi:hypothetical protein
MDDTVTEPKRETSATPTYSTETSSTEMRGDVEPSRDFPSDVYDETYVACPGSFRELTNVLTRVDGRDGLQKLCETLNFKGVTMNQIYAATLARLPESRSVCKRIDSVAARLAFKSFLLSKEFQDRIIENVLKAYPERHRILYVHIPKSAGTDLSTDLGARFPAMRQTLMYRSDTDTDALFAELAKIMLALERSDSIFVCGHNTLNWYLEKGLVRFGDDVFTVVRNPFQLVVSHVNYAVTLMLDKDETRLDHARFWAALDQAPPREPLNDAQKRELALRVLYTPKLIESNYLCRYLGDETYDGAVDSIVRSGVEVVDLRRYEEWRTGKWGLPQSERKNRSQTYLDSDVLEPEHREFIMHITQEDRKLYNVLTRAWANGARNSFVGVEILDYL